MWFYFVSETYKDRDGLDRELFTVAFQDTAGKFHGDSDHASRESAAKRVHYLNGGKDEIARK